MRFAFFAENKCGYTHLFSVQRYHMFLKYASIYDEKVLFSTYIILNMSNITFALRRCSVTQIQLMKQIDLRLSTDSTDETDYFVSTNFTN